MHHFRPGVRLQREEVKYPHFRQQTLNKRQVALLVLIYLFTLRISLSQREFILPAMQGVLLQDFTHHFRDRFVYEETVRAELFIQQGEIRLDDNLIS